MRPSDLWRQPSHWPLSTVLLTWLSPSWNAAYLYIDLVKKDLLLGVTFHSFLALEISRNKIREFPVSIPFPLPVCWDVLRPLLVVTGRKIIGTTERGGTDLNGILNPFWTIERTNLLSVSSSYCSIKWANLPPTGMSGLGRTGSGKGWFSEFCGRWGLLRGGELFRISTSLSIVFITGCVWLCLTFRPVRLRLLRPGRFSRSLKDRRSQISHFLLLLLYISSSQGSCQEPLLMGLKIALGNFLNLIIK